VAFDGDALQEQAMRFLAIAEQQGATVPFMIGHRLMGMSSMFTGNIMEGRVHLDQAIALYDPIELRPPATRFGQDIRVVILSFRSWGLWSLGHVEAALADADDAVNKSGGVFRACARGRA
jgi:hypothetical protein